MNLLRSFAVAFAMYSKIPVPNVEWNGKSMKYAMCFFPAVGAVAGFLQFLAGYLIMNHTDCGKFFFSAVMVLIPVVVTGGIHLDGYADTVDALSSYGEREKKLEILKDPHTGAFALIWVCVWFVADLALWSEVSAEALAVLACTYVFSRSLSGISVVSFQPAKNSGLLRTFHDGAHRKRVRAVMIIWALLDGGVMAYFSPHMAAAAIAAALLVFLYYYRMSRKQFGGTTGDLAGYFLQLSELAMLAAVVLADKISR